MMSITDKEILKILRKKNGEPSLRRIDGNRVIYAPRGLEIPDDFSDFVVCDFGCAVFGEKKYIGETMPDLYRPPELVLRTTWDEKIDIWSLGSMCWTVLGGAHLLKDRLSSRNDPTPARIARIIALLGPPPKDMLERGSWSNNFFDESGKFKEKVQIATTSLQDEMKSIEGEEKTSFLKFLRRMLQWRDQKIGRLLESWSRILGYKLYWQAK